VMWKQRRSKFGVWTRRSRFVSILTRSTEVVAEEKDGVKVEGFDWSQR
jgi:hypothetical protein